MHIWLRLLYKYYNLGEINGKYECHYYTYHVHLSYPYIVHCQIKS